MVGIKGNRERIGTAGSLRPNDQGGSFPLKLYVTPALSGLESPSFIYNVFIT